MAKKTVKSTRKSKKDRAIHLTIVIVSVFLLAVGITVFFNLTNKPFCANSITCINDLSGRPTEDTKGEFMGKTFDAPIVSSKTEYALESTRAVLGDTTEDNKHIYVDLGHQRLYAYQGNNLVYNFPVSTGKWNATPTGDFHIWIWLRATRMAGGNRADGSYYNLPNVPYTMYYSNEFVPKSDGYSIHGAYWHNNFGHPMSHGCVNMRPADAAKIFYWTNPSAKWTAYPTPDNPGTLITVYGTANPAETAFAD